MELFLNTAKLEPQQRVNSPRLVGTKQRTCSSGPQGGFNTRAGNTGDCRWASSVQVGNASTLANDHILVLIHVFIITIHRHAYQVIFVFSDMNATSSSWIYSVIIDN